MSENVLLVIDKGLGVDILARLITSLGTTARLAILNHHVDLQQLAKEPRNFYDKAVSYSLSSKFHTQELVSQLTGLLKPGSPVEFREAVVPAPAAPGPLRTVDDLCLLVSLSGCVEITQNVVECEPSVAGLVGDAGARVGVATVTAKVPEWSVGAAIPLRRNKAAAAPKAGAVWTISAIDDEVGDLINEDDLLEADDLKIPSKTSDDCEFDGAGRAKPCKDCTCGRAEEEFTGSKPVAVAAPTSVKPAKSACGSCYLGDAFRCATCPSLGLPAYKPGEVVKISLD